MWDICDTKVYLGFNASLFPIIRIWKKVEDLKVAIHFTFAKIKET
jgi:hypothetical protein